MVHPHKEWKLSSGGEMNCSFNTAFSKSLFDLMRPGHWVGQRSSKAAVILDEATESCNAQKRCSCLQLEDVGQSVTVLVSAGSAVSNVDVVDQSLGAWDVNENKWHDLMLEVTSRLGESHLSFPFTD